jgi:hypothetical protein
MDTYSETVNGKSRNQFFAGIYAGLLIFALCFPGDAKAGETGGKVRQGLASQYKGDKGIEKDRDVIFVENFEVDSLDAVKARWESVKSLEIMSLSPDVPAASAGKYSLLMSHIGGKGAGGHLYRRLLPGYEQLYVRFYVKFDRDCNPIHHFVHVGGYNPSTPWSQGGAGIVARQEIVGARFYQRR